ncbi:hypothetical protein NDU88_000810 [Pleurodeles waltl]|uniref:Uncharacterized protein n=1 Tax=Pleurodeles waltl TaxID=8319 RepID=A0AAV7LWL5_PLEWA|nr:hypothetical protein NDU88_000810 [Pleurodeles waltl]
MEPWSETTEGQRNAEGEEVTIVAYGQTGIPGIVYGAGHGLWVVWHPTVHVSILVWRARAWTRGRWASHSARECKGAEQTGDETISRDPGWAGTPETVVGAEQTGSESKHGLRVGWHSRDSGWRRADWQ